MMLTYVSLLMFTGHLAMVGSILMESARFGFPQNMITFLWPTHADRLGTVNTPKLGEVSTDVAAFRHHQHGHVCGFCGGGSLQ
jgi:hypothetical protein